MSPNHAKNIEEIAVLTEPGVFEYEALYYLLGRLQGVAEHDPRFAKILAGQLRATVSGARDSMIRQEGQRLRTLIAEGKPLAKAA